MKKSASEREWLIIQLLARRAKNGYKVPEGFLDCAASIGHVFVTGDKAMKDAEKLAKMYRSDEYGVSYIVEYKKINPISTPFAEAIHKYVENNHKQSDRGKKDRPDTLNRFINECVRSNPTITTTQLLKEIKKLPTGDGRNGEIIEEITEDEIYFIEDGKGGNSATISGLKDRLSKAKKKIKINNSL